MNTSNIILTGVYMLILVCGIASGEAENDEKQSEIWGQTVAGCRLSVTADQASYHVSEPIRLKIIMENVGEGRISASRFGSGLTKDYKFDLRLPDGDPAPLTLFGKRQDSLNGSRSFSSLTLGPGETDLVTVPRFNRIYLDRLYDMTLAGEYTLTVKRRFLPSGFESVRDWKEVSSNTIKIAVREEIEEKEQTEQESEKQEKENSLSDEDK